MTARRTNDPEPLTAFGMPPPHGVARARQVISIAPNGEAPDMDTEGMTTSPRPKNEPDVFLAPRVIDQRAFDELAGSLRSLVNEAEVICRKLEENQSQSENIELQGRKTSMLLQERLRLSARILKAFQTQIERVEKVMTQLDRYEENKASFDQNSENTLNFESIAETLERKMFERVAEAVAHVEIRLESKARELAATMFENQATSAPPSSDAASVAQTLRDLADSLINEPNTGKSNEKNSESSEDIVTPDIAVGTDLNRPSAVDDSPSLKFQGRA